MFYVLGTVDGKLEFMTRKPFMVLASAEKYAAACGSAFKAFVVKTI